VIWVTTASIYSGDQPVLKPAVFNGVIEGQTPTIMDNVGLPAGYTNYVFSVNFVLVYNGQTISFRPNIPNAIDTALFAALTAAGAAPYMTQE